MANTRTIDAAIFIWMNMGIFEVLFLMLKWMRIFVLLQMCLGNADAWIWMNIYVLLQVYLGNAAQTKHEKWCSVKKWISFFGKYFPETNAGNDFP